MALTLQPPSLRRPPGVRFEVPPEAPDETLPRMDIAFFVGFAGSGPLTAAVAVESLAEFEAVFGTGLVLARESASGTTVSGLLHPAVRGFFSQGGRRCWVLRVAGATARSSRFALPSMLAVSSTCASGPSRIEPATLLARSPGSGGDAVKVATRITATRLSASLMPTSAGQPPALRIANAPTGLLRAGDVLRIATDDGLLHTRIASVVAMSDPHAPGDAAQRVVLGRTVALQPLEAASPSPWPSGVALPALEDFEPPVTPPALTAPSASEWLNDGRLSIGMRVPLQRLPQRGEVLGLAFGISSSPSGGSATDAWMPIEDVDITGPVDLDGQIDVTLVGIPWQVFDAACSVRSAALVHGNAGYAVELLRLDLRTQSTPDDRALLIGLSLASHDEPTTLANSVCDLPGDERVFSRDATSTDPGPAVAAAVQRDALGRLHSRFPLASESVDGERLVIPLGDLSEFDGQLGTLPDPLTALERDGLTSFGWSLFGEATLAAQATDELADAAEALASAGRVPQPLRGMHAAFGGDPPTFADQPTLLAVPDAVHAGWQKAAQPASPWTELPPLNEPPHPCAEEAFKDCAAAPLPRPHFVRGADPLPDGRYTLYWTEPIAGASYELQEAPDAGFATAVTIYQGKSARLDAIGASGESYYRVRALDGLRISPWSAPVRIDIGVQGYETLPWHPAHLLAIHRLMLRTAAARGDMLAVLALPEAFDAAQAIAYTTALRSTRGDVDPRPAWPSPIGSNETRALSHGAVHHPWLMIRRDDRVVWFPPDGSACGQLAASALERGAWIAVANKPLRDVVALGLLGMRPTSSQRQQLLDAQVNLLRSAPVGFIASTADTLSSEAEWRPINVRRLMSLLRRLALQRGVTYVFEPNGAALRRTVERSFAAMLDDLFRRGAFSGARPELAYRVNVGAEINTPQRRDAGQFWVELQVAPALPMSFLTVRLSRSGERVLSRETH
jgi:hypothetical protein